MVSGLVWLVAAQLAAPDAVANSVVANDAVANKLRSPIVCDSCEEWNKPHKPFRLFGNTYYVGTEGLTVVLIAADSKSGAGGHILIDAGLPQSVGQIESNLAALGFAMRDVKLHLVSHEHYDHVGGMAALQSITGAEVVAGEPAVRALRSGMPLAGDPQHHSGTEHPFPPVASLRVVEDGELLHVGALTVQAHRTPGHTQGGTSWTWRSCEGARCLNMVFADSLNPISDDDFFFSSDQSRVVGFFDALGVLSKLPCDVLLTGHPGSSELFERAQSKPSKLINPKACRKLSARLKSALQERLKKEKSVAAH